MFHLTLYIYAVFVFCDSILVVLLNTYYLLFLASMVLRATAPSTLRPPPIATLLPTSTPDTHTHTRARVS